MLPIPKLKPVASGITVSSEYMQLHFIALHDLL